MAEKRTASESELLRLLNHARGCDGHADCDICRTIDLRLADGLPHATDDPARRFMALEVGLKQVRDQSERVFGVLEGAPVPPSTRRAVQQLINWVSQLQELLRVPVTSEDKYTAKPDHPEDHVEPPPSQRIAPLHIPRRKPKPVAAVFALKGAVA